MSSNAVWAFVFTHAITSMSLSAVAVVTGWLAARKFIGHRRILIAVCAFSVVRSASQVYAMVRSYTHTPETNISLVFSVLSMGTVAWVATLLIMDSLHLLETLTRTEAKEMVRQDNQKDIESVQKIYQYMAEENRLASNSMIAKFAERSTKAQ